MVSSRICFLGGNGHCTARLASARRFLARIELDEVPYPGFEDRPRASSLSEFLDAVSIHLRTTRPVMIYAMGIAGLLVLCLQARGELAATPIVLQGPILWGLEHRWMPKLMRLRPAQAAMRRIFASKAFQRRFVRRYFTRPLDAEMAAAFFDGYARCSAAPDFFAWFNPALLRSLERDLAARPAALEGIEVWWGGQDRVVTPRELEWTKQALGLGDRWPLRVFSGWGHYPMIDEPASWASALSDAVANAGAV
jgi:pimeloyl-ACP methyl ester carboxylesterase